MRWIPGLLLALAPVAIFAGTPFEDRGIYIEDREAYPEDSGAGAPSFIGLTLADLSGDSVTDVAGPVPYKDIAVLLQDPARQGWTGPGSIPRRTTISTLDPRPRRT